MRSWIAPALLLALAAAWLAAAPATAALPAAARHVEMGSAKQSVRAAPAASPAAAAQADEEGPDIATLALITMGAVLGAAGLGLVFYLIRLRIGFWLHRPPPRSGGEGPPGQH